MLTLERTNKVFAAFADPTRLRVLNLLRDGELCVCELVRVLGMSQPKISRHLAILREADLVEDRKDGRWVHYSLAKPPAALHKRLLGCVGECFADVELLRDDLKRLNRRGKNCGN
jgi:ArsR family transcriptional regulator, arsenate/arsenite/antimonite-responsive transcriptional repressor